jgi:hypothetical protein
LVHPIPRTRSLPSFLRNAVAWVIVLPLAQFLAFWYLIAAFDGGDWKMVWPSTLGVFLGMLASTVSQVAVTKMQGLSGVLDVHQSVTMTLSVPVTTAVESFRDALTVIRATEVQAVGERHFEIWAKARGNQIRFSCHPNLDGSLEVHIRSGPRGRWVFFDLGTNLTNVRRLASAFWWREMRQRYAS